MSSLIREVFVDGPAFIPYIAAGDPGGALSNPTPAAALEATQRYVQALVEGGADIIELGLPFSEPIADGPTIREASARALDAGMTPTKLIDMVSSFSLDIPIVVMTYYNPIYRYGPEPGVEDFVTDAAAAGVDGLIVPDLPVEESRSLRAACRGADVDLIYIAAPTTRDDRLATMIELVDGYLYVQARLGTTGARQDVSDRTTESLDRIRRFEEHADRDPIPKAVGFGISNGHHATEVIAAGADGIIVGSALVDIISGADRVDEACESLRELADDLTEGAQAGWTQREHGPEAR